MTFPTAKSLAYTHSGQEHGRRVWVIHGIMGSRQNWSRFARHLHLASPHLSITTIDLRCHGESAHFSKPHSISSCVDDLFNLAEQIGPPEVLIGHSFGGKVALAYAVKASQQPDLNHLDCIWTLDSPLEADLRPGHGEVARVIEACGQMPMPQPSRQSVIEYFTTRGFALGVAQWMTTNLKRVKKDQYPQGGFQWKFNLTGIKELITDYWKVDGWELLSNTSPLISINLLRAERGLRWTEADAQRIEQEFAHISTPLLKDSGHWVHIDQLDTLIKLLGEL